MEEAESSWKSVLKSGTIASLYEEIEVYSFETRIEMLKQLEFDIIYLSLWMNKVGS
jgi:hypothetical protein